MAEPRFWQHKNAVLSLALTPLSLLYGGLEALNRRLTQPQHPGKPVICIGNLTVGGGGKTPTVACVYRWLCDDGFTPAILSRGYGGREKGPLRVDPTLHDATAVGDEPLMLAAEAPVYIGADRMASLRCAVADGHDVLIKDDGFQNPKLAHHFNLLVVDAASGLGNQRLLPAGPLRQPLPVALGRLDALLVIGDAPTAHPSVDLLLDMVEALGKPVFFGRTEPSPTGNDTVHGFCGIAKPQKFRASLQQAGYRVSELTAFGDHHPFSEAEAKRLLASTQKLITTRKDMARLVGAPEGSARAQLAAKAMVLDIALQVEAADELRAAMRAAMQDKQANRLYTSY